MKTVILPPDGRAVGKLDGLILSLQEKPNEWVLLATGPNVSITSDKRRFGKSFEFVTRTNKMTREMYGRFIGSGTFDTSYLYSTTSSRPKRLAA